jgi:hypothetical protein
MRLTTITPSNRRMPKRCGGDADAALSALWETVFIFRMWIDECRGQREILPTHMVSKRRHFVYP